MYDNFEEYMIGIKSFYSDWTQTILGLTDKLFKLKNNTNGTEIIQVGQDELVPKRFYLIQYSYNGNFLWVPIFSLEYKVHKNNHILYALNLEYLPPRYKIKFFNILFKMNSKKLEEISDTKNLSQEPPLKYLSTELIYKTLKNHGKMEYVIDGFTIKNSIGELKIKKVYLCSIKIAPEIILSDMKKVNSIKMKDRLKISEGEEHDKLAEIIEQYDKLIEEYEMDSIVYHKKVALFRNKLKLFK